MKLWTIVSSIVFVIAIPSATASDCTHTSTGRIPLTDLGPSTYQGFQGGLYPGGSNAMSIAHRLAGMNQAALVVPRDAAGAPSAAGKIVFLSIGMSNCTQEFQRFIQLATPDPLRNPRVQLVDGAQGGQTAAMIQDPAHPFWTVVDQRLATANATAEQVQVIWFKEADAGPTTGFPAATQTLKDEFVAIMQVIRDRFPNARLCFLASRIYAGYATSALNPEPYAYEQGFAVKWTIEDQIAGDAALEFDPSNGMVAAPWLAWGTYNWADGLTPRSDGLTWQCADFNTSDGTHPAESGRTKVATALLDFVHTEPIAASWYLAAPPPAKFGAGTTAALGVAPSIGWSGTPSFAAHDFALTFSNAMPRGIGVVFASSAADLMPLAGGALYLGSPRTRLRTDRLDGNGATSVPIPISAADVGTTRFYQGLFRSGLYALPPAAPVPTAPGVALSDGLRVVFRN